MAPKCIERPNSKSLAPRYYDVGLVPCMRFQRRCNTWACDPIDALRQRDISIETSNYIELIVSIKLFAMVGKVDGLLNHNSR
eukprot:10055650-Karenia_brevis.AAC.1